MEARSANSRKSNNDSVSHKKVTESDTCERVVGSVQLSGVRQTLLLTPGFHVCFSSYQTAALNLPDLRARRSRSSSTTSAASFLLACHFSCTHQPVRAADCSEMRGKSASKSVQKRSRLRPCAPRSKLNSLLLPHSHAHSAWIISGSEGLLRGSGSGVMWIDGGCFGGI